MAKLPVISISKNALTNSGTLAVLVASDLKIPAIAASLDKNGQLKRAIKVAKFEGKIASCVDVMVPEGGLDRILLIGCGEPSKATETDWLKVGGKIFSAAGKAAKVTIVTEAASDKNKISTEAIALVAAGAKLSAYQFDDYKTKSDNGKPVTMKIALGADEPTATKRNWQRMSGVTDGVLLARQLVNEPANVLGPVEFARKAQGLKSLGVKVQVLGDAEMKKLGMHALLGVAVGSEKPARMAIMQWDGGKKGEKPLAFIGKGVVFDTGGISIKPAGNMEDMKGDMGGAAAVTGLMHALASRKAKANVVGIIGLVENMPDGKAQRPGDIVTSMSKQTIEIINTDAEGRLVLADALWYCQKRFKPKFMINLATLTGAILVALGKTHAGIFSNNDELADNLFKAGQTTGERVWRLPLDPDYDKLIDSKNADMKNTGGRYAGSIAAGQFLQRFVNDVPWVHIDVAGTAMGSPQNEFNRSWGSGYGVRLLDRLVSDFYE